MNGDRVQALKTVDVAKRMISDNDYMGARSKLLEVHYQFPSLGNIPHMITTCDILCSTELTLPNGETDWYWVLQLGPAATFSQISSRHDKLTSLLNGIKDEFPNAVADALQLVRDAFFVLSNIPKRLVFDSKRLTSWEAFSPSNSVDKTGYESDKITIQEQDSSPFSQSSDSKNADVTKISGSLDKRSSVVIELDGSDDLLHDDDVHYLGKASGDAESIPSSWNSISKEETQNLDNLVVSIVDNDISIEKSLPDLSTTPIQRSDGGFYNFDGIRKAESFAVGQIWAAYDDENLPRRYARIDGISKSPFRLHITWLRPVPQSIHEGKWCEVGLPVVCGLFNLHGDEEPLVEHTIFSHLVSYTASPTNEEFKIYPRENEVWAIYEEWKPFSWCDDPESRKGSTLQIVQIIEGYPRQERVIVAALVKVDGHENIYKRDNEDNVEGCFEIPLRCIFRFSHRLPAYGFQDREMSGVSFGMFELDPLAVNASSFSAYEKCQSSPSARDNMGNSLKMEWSAEDFASGQVWAIYDGSDQMPRCYAVVNEVISSVEVTVTFLEPHPICGEEISWVEENLPPGCGTFRKGATLTTLQMGKFSHLIDCDRSTKKIFYKIYPKKGEVWAMYRNWNSKWKKQDFDRYHCRIVEILSDFSEESGLLIAGLEEVPGYKTFFQRQLCDDGFALNRAVSKSEMLSFSHRVEAFVVPGIKSHGIPEWSWHLEPDALPPVLAN